MSNEESFTWEAERKLIWADFKGRPDRNSEAVALTASGLTFGYSITTSNKNIVGFTATIEAHFYPRKSWYFKDKANAYILAHEQLHFDITELYARKFRKELEGMVTNNNIKRQLDQLHQSINEDLDITQKTYDFETNHSINIEAQKYWNDFIAKELQKLDKYKSDKYRRQ
jgi:hypothetical protein